MFFLYQELVRKVIFFVLSVTWFGISEYGHGISSSGPFFMILPLYVSQKFEDLRFIINVFRLRVLNVPLSHLGAQELELSAI